MNRVGKWIASLCLEILNAKLPEWKAVEVSWDSLTNKMYCSVGCYRTSWGNNRGLPKCYTLLVCRPAQYRGKFISTIDKYPFVYSWCVNKSCDFLCVPACGSELWPWPLLTANRWPKITSESGIDFSNTTSIFREMKSCSVARVYGHFKGMNCLRLQGRIVGQTSNLLTRFTLQPWRRRHYILLKIQ